MKRINKYINEKLYYQEIDEKLYHQEIEEKLIVNNTIHGYNYHPKDKDELIDCIKKKIKQEGLGTKDESLDLNDIDTSEITDMRELFDVVDGKLQKLSENGYFDISDWDVSNVKDMSYMFYESNFDGDISIWDVSNVEIMNHMFAWSNFNGDISDWNVSSVENMTDVFYECPLQNNPPKWFKNWLNKQ